MNENERQRSFGGPIEFGTPNIRKAYRFCLLAAENECSLAPRSNALGADFVRPQPPRRLANPNYLLPSAYRPLPTVYYS